MAAKIGILGESTSVTSNTDVTLYLVPDNKAARIRILFMMEGKDSGGDGPHMVVRIGSPGTEKMITMDGAAAQDDLWSGRGIDTTSDPLLALNGAIGLQDLNAGLGDMDGDNTNGNKIISALTEYWILNTGDTVVRRWPSNDPAAALIQVIGVEDDA